ncbi:TonB-dependent receptor [Sphingosinicella sp. LHD-64]|uniref:TonB-dependent receptor n=1 Tax=Sphingosinicella sp. LHD-64 TaxID=3072139 RepID=UPI00280D2DF4|nr:TonB-dependent receptor [Sphingosinicella sp. LHD-64]MDQ8754627.1 TonB-dependent receptor [Sphingosinicella sp. LHD-64]
MRLASLALSAAILIHAPAVAAGARHQFNLPAGRLGDALVALGQQAGISIGVSDPSLASRHVASVRGRMSVDQALTRLLQGSGGRPIAIDARTYRVVRAPEPVRQAAMHRRPHAPPLPPVEIEQPDIIITASKRSFRLASFPGAVLLAEGDDPVLAAYGQGTEGLTARLPGLNSTHLGTGRNKLFIRGIADSSFNGPTQATVGQYLGETRLNYNTPDPNLRLQDIERVEVLPGPQGTLYGAGSLGGILRIVPNAPRLGEVQGAVSAGASLTEHGDPGGEASAMLNLPIVADAVGLRLVGYGATEGGYIDDTLRGLDDVNRTRTYGGRARLRAHAGSWTIDAGIAGQYIRGEDGQFADRDAPPLTRASPIAEDYTNEYLLADVVVERGWGDGMRFVTTAGFVRQRLEERYDSSRPDEAPQAYDQLNRLTMFSAESRLSRGAGDGTGWLIGTSFISHESELERALGDPDGPLPITGVRNTVNEITAFGEATFRLAEGVTATAGGRITHSRLSGSVLDAPESTYALLATLRAHRSETVFLPSFAVAAEARDDLLFYARYQEGFRPGGLSVFAPFTASVAIRNGVVAAVEPGDAVARLVAVGRFENDEVATLEAGLRYGRPGAGAFDLAASVAYTRWTDIQADVIDLFGFQSTQNIGNGRIYTLDVRANWRPVPGLNLEAAAVLNDSEVTNPAPSIIIGASSPLPNVAKVNGYFGTDYRIDLADDLALTLWGSGRYAGTSRLGIGPILGEEQGDWFDLSAGARLERGRHAFTLGITNLLDTVGNRFAMGSPFTLALQRQITPLRPRTVRIGWELRF